MSYEDYRDLANIICMSLVYHLFLREIISSLVRMFDNQSYSIDYQIRLIKHLWSNPGYNQISGKAYNEILDNFSSTSFVFIVLWKIIL